MHTGPDDTLRATVRMPAWVESGKPLVFTVAEADGGWNVRTPPFDVTPGAKLQENKGRRGAGVHDRSGLLLSLLPPFPDRVSGGS